MPDPILMKLFRRTLAHEGGYQSDPDDDGNWTGGKKGLGINKGTKYGISARQYPHLDIINLTEEEAVEIYLVDYYMPLQNLQHINSAKIQWKLFDIGFNMGLDDPPRIVRNALTDMGYVTGDGLEWDRLNDATTFWKTDQVILRELAEWQMRKYVDIVVRQPVKVKYLPGWTRRAFDIGDGLA